MGQRVAIYCRVSTKEQTKNLSLPVQEKACRDYCEREGYEIAGFVWFQGFNDLVGPYPGDPSKKSVKDYSEYSRLLGCLIRDLRKDLNTPNMPFVTGVLGVGGETRGDGTEAFRNAMAAPGEMDEFKGTVANVYTHKFWPADIEAIKVKLTAATAELNKQSHGLRMRAKKVTNSTSSRWMFKPIFFAAPISTPPVSRVAGPITFCGTTPRTRLIFFRIRSVAPWSPQTVSKGRFTPRSASRWICRFS